MPNSLDILNQDGSDPHIRKTIDESSNSPSDVHPAGDDGISRIVSAAARAVRRNKYFLCLWIFGWISLSGAYLFNAPNLYTAQSAIVLEPKAAVQVGVERGGSASESTLDTARADSQMQIIKSERLMHVLFDRLNLSASEEFLPEKPISVRILNYFSPTGDIGGGQHKLDDRQREEVAFQNFSNRVGVRRVGQSYVIEITYVARSPQLAAHIANAIAMAFIAQQIEAKSAAAQSTTEYLETRLKAFNGQLEAARVAIAKGQIPDVLFPDADSRVIGAAHIPASKSSPQTTLTLLAALIFSAVTGIVVVVVRQQLSGLVFSLDDLPMTARVKYLGSTAIVSKMRGHASFVIKTNSNIDNDLSRISTNLLDRISDNEISEATIGVIYWSNQDSNWIVSSALANYLALFERRVILAKLDESSVVSNCPSAVKSDEFNSVEVSHIKFDRERNGKVKDLISVASLRLKPGDKSNPTHRDEFPLTAGRNGDRPLVRIVVLPPMYKGNSLKAYAGMITDIVLVIGEGNVSKNDCIRVLEFIKLSRVGFSGIVLYR